MALRINRICITLKVVADVEIRDTRGGKKLAKFRGVHSVRKQQNGQWVDAKPPCFVDVTVWGGDRQPDWTMETAAKLGRGDNVYIEGELELEEWEDRNGGGKRSKHSITARVLQLIGGGQQQQPQDDLDDKPAPAATGYADDPDPSMPF